MLFLRAAFGCLSACASVPEARSRLVACLSRGERFGEAGGVRRRSSRLWRAKLRNEASVFARALVPADAERMRKFTNALVISEPGEIVAGVVEEAEGHGFEPAFVA